MEGFYLEAGELSVLLCYKYPSRVKQTIMKVDKYEKISQSG
jgi:hypothetical protein